VPWHLPNHIMPVAWWDWPGCTVSPLAAPERHKALQSTRWTIRHQNPIRLHKLDNNIHNIKQCLATAYQTDRTPCAVLGPAEINPPQQHCRYRQNYNALTQAQTREPVSVFPFYKHVVGFKQDTATSWQQGC
jgi:hypothetical protein